MNTPRYILKLMLGLLILPSGFSSLAQSQDSADTSGNASVQAIGEIRKIEGGFQFVEGPTRGADGAVYFTDIPANQILVWRDGEPVSVFIEPSLHANGLMFEAGGKLIACQMDGQVVAYDLKTKQATTLADRYEGVRLNAPNDLVIDQQGGIYFTDPLYRAPEPLPQGMQAFYYITTDGTVTRVSGDLPAPNGIGLSPDGSKLYIVPSMSGEMLVYDVQGPGQLSQPRRFCNLNQKQEGENSGGDGMTVDTAGNVYITTNLGVQVFSPEGKLITIVEFPEHPANVTFAGPKRNLLVVTARTGLYAVKLNMTGLEPRLLNIKN